MVLDFEHFASQMRLKYVFPGKNKEIHPFYIISNWNPPVQPSVALESYLGEVKSHLAEIEITKPKCNLSHKEHQARTHEGSTTVRLVYCITSYRWLHFVLCSAGYITGTVTLWLEDSMDCWFDGSVVRWIDASMDRWFDGSVDRMFDGLLVQCWLFSGDLLKSIWIGWPQVLKTKLGFRAVSQNPFISTRLGFRAILQNPFISVCKCCDCLCILLCFGISSRVFILLVYKKVKLTLSIHIALPLICEWGFASLVEVI